MKMPRPTDEAKERFRELVGDFAEATVRPMFANLGAFVNGHMFAGLLGNVVGVKLLDKDLLREARSTPGTVAFGPGGEPLREYVGFPVDWPRDELSDWLAVAYSQLRELPPKEKKKR